MTRVFHKHALLKISTYSTIDSWTSGNFLETWLFDATQPFPFACDARAKILDFWAQQPRKERWEPRKVSLYRSVFSFSVHFSMHMKKPRIRSPAKVWTDYVVTDVCIYSVHVVCMVCRIVWWVPLFIYNIFAMRCRENFIWIEMKAVSGMVKSVSNWPSTYVLVHAYLLRCPAWHFPRGQISQGLWQVLEYMLFLGRFFGNSSLAWNLFPTLYG